MAEPKRPSQGTIDADVLVRLERGPLRLKASNEVRVSPTTLKESIKSLRHRGYQIVTDREATGGKANVYTLAGHAG
jgi:hypothetical protein